MNKKELRVIKGGKPLTFADEPKKFKWAYVTNTRLMGVVFLCMCWEMNGSEFYQLFYFDAEEFGFDTYASFNEKGEMFEWTVDAMSGGLGGTNIDITEDEALSLVSSFIEYNLDHHIDMPANAKEYMWMFNPSTAVSRETFAKMCENIVSTYQLINYYVMRLLGKDFEAADFLTDGMKSTDYYPSIKGATLCKNTIDSIPGEAHSFMCECVLDLDNGLYNILTCQVDVKDLKVIGFTPVSRFKVTPEEVALKIVRSEYITLVHYLGEMDEFTKEVTPLLKKSTMTDHEHGRLYMLFNPDNSHVNKKVFQLNGDVYGTFYITDNHHILLTSFDEETVAILEKELGSSKLASKCRVRKRFEFSHPVLFMFIESGMRDFKEFVKLIED